jgi:heptosyltransferase-2
VLLMGGREDQAACDALAAELGPGAASAAGRTSLPEWAALLRACDVVVANDSGGMHLAAALAVPVVALYGMTNPEQTGPLGPACRVLQEPGPRARDIARDSAEAQKRLAALSPERVYQAAAGLLTGS